MVCWVLLVVKIFEWYWVLWFGFWWLSWVGLCVIVKNIFSKVL